MCMSKVMGNKGKGEGEDEDKSTGDSTHQVK